MVNLVVNLNNSSRNNEFKYWSLKSLNTKIFVYIDPSNIGPTISIARFLNSSWSIRDILKNSTRNIEIKSFVFIKIFWVPIALRTGG